jgi:hypothetical protein
MADFRSAIALGVTLEAWEDPASLTRASRLNPQAEHEHKRQVGTVGVQIELRATVAGVEAPLDGALGGRLFSAAFHEAPALPPPTLSNPAGQTSVQRFTPLLTGHYTLQLTRTDGGAVIHHIDVDP